MKRRRRPSSSHERAPGGRRAPQCQVGEQSQVGKEWWENSESGSPSRRALGEPSQVGQRGRAGKEGGPRESRSPRARGRAQGSGGQAAGCAPRTGGLTLSSAPQDGRARPAWPPPRAWRAPLMPLSVDQPPPQPGHQSSMGPELCCRTIPHVCLGLTQRQFAPQTTTEACQLRRQAWLWQPRNLASFCFCFFNPCQQDMQQ